MARESGVLEKEGNLSLIIEVRGSQTSSRKEELRHRRKRKKCGKVGHHRGLKSSQLRKERESHTERGASLASWRKKRVASLRKEGRSLASWSCEGVGHLRAKRKSGITEDQSHLGKVITGEGGSLASEVRGTHIMGEGASCCPYYLESWS